LPVHARVLIVARDDTLVGPLAEGLDRLGWRTVTARGPYAALAALGDMEIEVAIIDASLGADEAATLGRRLKAACAPRRLAVIAIGLPDPDHAGAVFDLTLSPPLHPAQAAMRLDALVRMTIAEEEFELRSETFADRGRRLDLPEEPPGPYRVLAIGEPAPEFLALSHALIQSGDRLLIGKTTATPSNVVHPLENRIADSIDGCFGKAGYWGQPFASLKVIGIFTGGKAFEVFVAKFLAASIRETPFLPVVDVAKPVRMPTVDDPGLVHLAPL